jgi:hypothetical protein
MSNMKKFWEAYINNDPCIALGDLLPYTFLMGLLVSGVVAWKAVLLYLLFYFLYHFVRGFFKAIYYGQ